jgi:uncharacterized membrane protein YfcA
VIPVLAWPAAVLVGVSLGLLGSGGSILTVPLLEAIVGVEFPVAVSTSLPIVGIVAGWGLVGHARRGRVDLPRALPFLLASAAFSFGARRLLAPWLPARAQAIAFAALMLLVAWRMAFGRPVLRADAVERPALAAALLAGAVAGTLTGLLGVGGGFVIVPALVLLLRFDVLDAIGTSLLVIATNCAAGLAAEVFGGAAAVRWDLVAVFGGAGVVGATLGTRFAHRLPQEALRRAFAVVVVLMAVALLLRTA